MPEADTLTVVIVDDEELGREAVRYALAEHGGFEVTGEASTGEEALELIRMLDPDVLFLDIRMPGMSGFDLLDELGPDRELQVVFVTAYDEHALRAFRYHALDYLLKPVEDDDLEGVLERIRSRMAGPSTPGPATLRSVLEAIREGVPEGGPGWLTRFTIREDERIWFLPVGEVDWIEADGNHMLLHGRRETHRIRDTLTRLEERLDPRQFSRVHRSVIVRIDAVREIQPWFSGDYLIVLRDGTQVRMSRRYRHALLQDDL